MEGFKKFQSLGNTTMLDSTNYGHWKVKMSSYIRGLDEDTWSAVTDGWTRPTDIIDGIAKVKPKRYETAKDAWDTLKLIHEGTSKVKRNRLDMIDLQFERLRMEYDESVKEFCGKLSALLNEASVLGRRISNDKLVKKLLNSLPAKYHSQILVFEGVNNLETVTFKEAVGTFAAHELRLQLMNGGSSVQQKKRQGIALHVPETRETVLESRKPVKNKKQSEEELHDEMASVIKKFNKFFKGKNKFGQQSDRDSGKCLECRGAGHWKAECPSIARMESVLKNLKKTQCFECRGFGHTKRECIKQKRKSLITHEDDSSNEESESDEDNLSNFVAFLGVIEEENDEVMNSDDEEVTEEELFEEMNKLVKMNKQLISDKQQLEKDLSRVQMQLTDTQQKLAQKEEEASLMKCQLEGTKKNLHLLGNGTGKLDHLLGLGRNSGLGYQGKSHSDLKFVSGGNLSQEPPATKRSSTHPRPFVRKTDWRGRENRSCYHCGKEGHLRRNCFYLRRNRGISRYPPPSYDYPPWNLRWVRKSDLACNVAYTTEQNNDTGIWYFDSGCSKHMTGNQALLKGFIETPSGGSVTFGDGKQGKILGKGTLDHAGLPKLTDVKVVQGLKANLISISQLCDNGMRVKFTKNACFVSDVKNKRVLTGKRNSNNCYTWINSKTESTQQTVKRISKYVNETLEFGLHYTKDSSCELVGFCNADWGDHADDRRSTSAEAEYMVLGSCCTQLLWMRQMLFDYGINLPSFTARCDDTSGINISKNCVQHHLLREQVEKKTMMIKYVPTEKQLVDIFTKPLNMNRRKMCRKEYRSGDVKVNEMKMKGEKMEIKVRSVSDAKINIPLRLSLIRKSKLSMNQ
ncbi:PREDICTED: uncharacterized protein LOC104825683 [Tarenaya hassleriana]|uniref:uncharacterized protein LOC104825683 n=1 Tax=Tarenaya hassleriana TaxID=28532 RepID=UPI00053C1BBC|nr:PREDICTED: uncharacterized protein LOC104825683 [Tarenaya hassleriana]